MAFHVACPITWFAPSLSLSRPLSPPPPLILFSYLALSSSLRRGTWLLSLGAPIGANRGCGCGCSERICYCELGFAGRLRREQGRAEFLEEVARVEEFLRDPWWVRAADGGGTAQVLVPRIVPQAAAAAGQAAAAEDGGGGEGEYVVAAQTKRAALQRQAAAASIAAEDYARRLEAGAVLDVAGDADGDLAREDQTPSTAKVICRICFSGENEGSDRAMKMLPCKTCNKKYHRSCLKSWAENRDLFHWSSWACPSCRICEVCRRAGDPNKFMFCKRCDAAYHCYCQQPPHKNVSRGPYLCPKHTRCHSCASSVPGSGPSTRWFLNYTCCDACGRLFVKGNYCPVCLKVYRDSESTPMVCCDDCQRWVHCSCDGISDEKYQQFQADGNLYYRCAACRGDCYQVKDIDDAVQELWRRRDKADRDLISSLRAVAGLPYQEDIFSISPFSDDEENGPMVLKSNHGRSLKFSVKGLADKVIKSAKEYGKKTSKNSSSNKKSTKKKAYELQLDDKFEEPSQNFVGQSEVKPLESSYLDEKNRDATSFGVRGSEDFQIPATSSEHMSGKFSVDKPEIENHSSRKEIVANNVDKVPKIDVDKVPKIDIKSSKSYGLHPKEGSGKLENKKEPVKGPKLVIHLGPRKNVTSSPISEASSCHREPDLAASNGSEASSQRKMTDNEKYMLEQKDGVARIIDGKGVKLENTNELNVPKYREREVRKLGKDSGLHSKISRGSISEEYQPSVGRNLVLQRLKTGGNAVETADEATQGSDEIVSMTNFKATPYNSRGESHGSAHQQSVSDPSRDLKPLLKLKFKNLYLENRSSWVSQGEEKSFVKGQRSKRKRPSPLMDKVGAREVGYTDSHQENMTEEVMDANWILQKLGKDAIGKRVEIHRQSDSSWHKGVVSDVIEGTASLLVRLDDGGTKTLELGKQGIRFISQKRRTKL